MMQEEENEIILVQEEEQGSRLDKFLFQRFPQYSRTYFQSLIEKQLVLVNGELVKKGVKIVAGDEIEIEFLISSETALKAEPISLEILFEDRYLLAINKPAGMVVHPAVGNWSGTFVNALLYHCNQLKKIEGLRPGIVHRLDKETSGVLLAAKDEFTQRKLVEIFAERKIEKEYLAICLGNPGNQTICGHIGRHPFRRKEMTVLQEGGKEAKTVCYTIANRGGLSLVRLIPHTGRTHQLRVHMKSLGTPILGDSVYGSSSANKKYHISRQLLHAHRLRFTHPVLKENVEIEAPIPQDMIQLINCLNNL